MTDVLHTTYKIFAEVECIELAELRKHKRVVADTRNSRMHGVNQSTAEALDYFEIVHRAVVGFRKYKTAVRNPDEIKVILRNTDLVREPHELQICSFSVVTVFLNTN